MSKPAPTSPHVRIRARIRTQSKAGASASSSGSGEPVPGDVDGEPLDRVQSTEAEPYAVGYKRPPRHTQFQKGQSGNPRGRPKGALNVETIVNALMSARRPVKIDGRDRTMSGAEIMLQQQAKKAMNGDHRATQFIVSLLQKNAAEAALSKALPVTSNPDETLGETEAAILLHHFRTEMTDRGLDEGAIEIALMALRLVPEETNR